MPDPDVIIKWCGVVFAVVLTVFGTIALGRLGWDALRGKW